MCLEKFKGFFIKRFCVAFLSNALIPVLYVDVAAVPEIKVFFLIVTLGVSALLSLLIVLSPIKTNMVLSIVSVLSGVVAFGLIQYFINFGNAP